jgi:hypothetical protein
VGGVHRHIGSGLGALALSAAACSPGPECAPEWSTLATRLGAAIVAVGGTASNDVYLVGGGSGYPDRGALVAHYDGRQWHELLISRSETLRFVHAPAKDDAWMGGDKGLILRFDGSMFKVIHEGGPTIFGAWASSASDVWFVGGLPEVGSDRDNDALFHWNGEKLEQDLTIPAKGVALLSIWGTSSEDLWISGENGTLWHRTHEGWDDRSIAVADGLAPFVVGGCAANEVYAVSGRQLYAFDGAAWQRKKAPLPTGARNVACGPRGALVVGDFGLKTYWDRESDRWSDEQATAPINVDLLGTWAAPEGSFWAVGGNLAFPGTRKSGVVAYHGCRPPSALTELDGPEPTDGGVADGSVSGP